MEHILEIIIISGPRVRASAIRTLGRAMRAVIVFDRSHNNENSNVNNDSDNSNSGPVLELVALTPLCELYGSPVYPEDVKQSSLSCLLSLLQQSGLAEQLNDGWGTLLRLLTEIAANSEQEILSLGFQSGMRRTIDLERAGQAIY